MTYPSNYQANYGGVAGVTSADGTASTLDSLVIGGQIELLAGGAVSDHPMCPGAMFYLSRDFSLSAPQPVVDLVQALGLDGERPIGRRASNRTPSLPVVIKAPDRDTLAAARELLLTVIDAETWPLAWTRAGGPTMILDCYRAAAADVAYSILHDRQLVALMTVTFDAQPYGRSDDIEVLQFASPSSAWSPPADPVTIDTYSTVSSATDGFRWSRADVAAAGQYSAHWSRDWHDRPKYSRTLPAPVNITGLAKITFWLGLGTSADQYHVWHGGHVTFSVTITDGNGYDLDFGVTKHCRCSGNAAKPKWNLISVTLPGDTRFDVATLSAYTVKAFNKTDPGGQRVLQAEAYLSGMAAVPPAAGKPASARGAMYLLHDVIGTARAPLNLQFTPGLSTLLTTWTKTTAGAGTSPVPGVSPVKAEAYGPGGGGGGSNSQGGGGGAGAGEYACEPALTVNPAAGVPVSVGAAGGGGTGGPVAAAGDDGAAVTTVSGTTRTVTANPGHGGKGKTSSAPADGGKGGSGSSNSIHYDGGDGAQASGAGGGGGGSGGTVSAGKDGGTPTNVTVGAAAVTGGGPGGQGGSAAVGQTPSVGPGGGGGGGGSGTHTGGAGRVGRVVLSWGSVVSTPVSALIVHAPGPGAPDTYQPLIPAGNGGHAPDGREYTIAPPGGALANWLAGDASGFEGGTAGWTQAGNCTIAQSSAWANTGTGSLALTSSGTSNMQAASCLVANVATQGLPCTAGDVINATAVFRAATAGRSVNAGADFYNSAGTLIGSSLRGADGTDSTTGAVTVSAMVTAPAGSAHCRANIQVKAPGAAGEVHYADDVTLANVTAGSLNTRYRGTHTVYAIAASWANPANPRTVTVTVKQYDGPGGRTTSVSTNRLITPGTDISNGIALIGELTLPPRDITRDQTAAYFTAAITSGETGDRFLDILLLDTMGETYVINSASGFANIWIDEPAPDRAAGNVLGSAGDRDQASSILDETVIGGPVSAEPGDNWLLAYCPAGAPAMTASYLPRWRLDRLQ